MPPTDEELLDFDRSRLASYDKKWTAKALDEVPELYRNHLTIAKWVDYWRAGLERPSPTDLRDDRYKEGLIQGLREIAAHLRQADFVPGGTLYEFISSRPPAG